MDKIVYKNAFPFLPILTLIFITLKLTGHISWSWWWVTAPLWGGLALFLAFLLGIVLVGIATLGFAFLALLIDEMMKKK